MRSPPPPRIRLPTHQRRAGYIRQRRDLTIAQRRIDMLPSPRPHPRKERHHIRIARVQPRCQIRNRDSDFDRLAIPAARNVHESHFRLDHDVVAGLVAVGPRLAIARDAGVDEGGIQRGEGGVVEGVLCEGVGEVVFDEDVAFFGKGVEDGYAAGVLEGEGEGLFVAVYLVDGLSLVSARCSPYDVDVRKGSRHFLLGHACHFL